MIDGSSSRTVLYLLCSLLLYCMALRKSRKRRCRKRGCRGTRCSLCRCGVCHWINVILLIDNGRVDETGSWVSNLHQDWFLSSEIYSACEECQFQISSLLEACMVEEII